MSSPPRPSPAPAQRPRKHLMTPGVPQQQQYSTNVTKVQKWVMSSLAVITIEHLAAGIVVAAVFSDTLDAQIGLLVIAAAFGVIAVVVALLIHQRSLLTPWLLAGLLPSVVGTLLLSR